MQVQQTAEQQNNSFIAQMLCSKHRYQKQDIEDPESFKHLEDSVERYSLLWTLELHDESMTDQSAFYDTASLSGSDNDHLK